MGLIERLSKLRSQLQAKVEYSFKQWQLYLEKQATVSEQTKIATYSSCNRRHYTVNVISLPQILILLNKIIVQNFQSISHPIANQVTYKLN